MRRQTERRAQYLHGFASTLQRTRNIDKAVGATVVAREQIAQQFAGIFRLQSAARVEQRVPAALQPLLGIEIGLAVADVIEDRHARTVARPAGCRSSIITGFSQAPERHSLPTVMSGASGCFIPTI